MWLYSCDQSDSMSHRYPAEPGVVFEELVRVIPGRFTLLHTDVPNLSCTFTCTSAPGVWGESMEARVTAEPDGAAIHFRCAGPVNRELHQSAHAARKLAHMLEDLSGRLPPPPARKAEPERQPERRAFLAGTPRPSQARPPLWEPSGD